MRKQILYRLTSIICVLLLAACSFERQPGHTAQGTYKVGTPYQINGVWYYPHEDFSYDETGIASWYGAAFHGGTTSNGEIFNKDELTAAHKTLPLPTLARVTNLENGKSIVVRINDRGPFSGDRIIDVSQRSAELLGFEQKGTAQVRVQVLSDESKAIADAERHYGGPSPTAVASAQPVSEETPVAPEAASSAASESVTAESLPPTASAQAVTSNGVEVKTLEPMRTTPAVHQELLHTQPVPQVVQLPVTGSHAIYVQAGAFTSMENAQRMEQRLSALGHVTVAEAIVNGRKFYRVRVGPLPDVPHADAMLRRVQSTGVDNARTVVD